MTSATPTPAQIRRIILAGLAGNVMEWYDFAIYGYFATVIGYHFFPSSDPVVSVIAAFGAFAAGYMMRPIGGFVFGWIGDVFGRKRVLTLSILAMAVPTVMIGLMPTYGDIGVAAPVILVALRLVQGLSVGGEYTSSVIYLAEQSHPDHRAKTAVWSMMGAVGGILLGSGVGAIFTNVLDTEQVKDWGWRIPFLLGSVIVLTGYLVRRSTQAEAVAPTTRNPIKEIAREYWRDIARIAALSVGQGVAFYAIFVYAVTYIRQIDGLNEDIAFDLNTASLGVLLVTMFAGAMLSDRFGRKPLLLMGYGMLTFGAIPFFLLIDTDSSWTIFLGEFGFVLGIGLFAGGAAAAYVEMLPTSVRCTTLALGYNLAVGIFGGTTPLVATYLVDKVGPIAPAYWILAASAVSLVTSLLFVRETRFDPLLANLAEPVPAEVVT
jgi:MHS family proline/betaine transporter-like MFS transporter